MYEYIVISGKQYSGKDTLAKILLEKLKDFKRIGIADAIKYRYGKENNLSFEEIEKNKHLYRQDLIELGNRGRAQSPDFWLLELINSKKIIIPDIRVVHEADFFRNRGAFLIRVNSTYENRSKRGIIVEGNDATETALDDYKHWDIVVENDSTCEDLIKKADKIIEKLLS